MKVYFDTDIILDVATKIRNKKQQLSLLDEAVRAKSLF